jgi:hypothetical protein
VDLPATVFSLSALCCSLCLRKKTSYLARAVLPGVLCGLAVACKYSVGVVLVSCGIATFLGSRADRRWSAVCVLALSAALTFFVAVPYSVLDFSHFRADVLYEARHYRTGHPGFDGPPGVAQFLYYLSNIQQDNGSIWCALAALGALWGLVRNPRVAMVVLSFPLLMLLHMSTNRVHFLRTVLPVFTMVPILACAGVFALWSTLSRFAVRLLPSKQMRSGRVGTRMLVVLGCVTALRLHPQRERLCDSNIRPDTRDQLAKWVADNPENGAHCYVSRDLWMPTTDLSPVPSRYLDRDDRQALDEILSSQHSGYLLLPKYGAPQEVPIKWRSDASKREWYINKARQLASAANAQQWELVQRLGAREVHMIQGKSTALETKLGRALSTDNPAIVVYYWHHNQVPS